MKDIFSIIAVVVFLITMAGVAFRFVSEYLKKLNDMSTEEKVEVAKKWLVLAVTEAEKLFGGGTGELKLLYVYDLFIGKFPTLARMIPFERFKDMVTWAINEMEGMLDSNDNIRGFIEECQEQGGVFRTYTHSDKIREEKEKNLKKLLKETKPSCYLWNPFTGGCGDGSRNECLQCEYKEEQ